MKANQKFLNGDDEAVSPVIAVILMVAITVVLAATVYVWVSGFGAQSSQPAKTVALTSASALTGGAKTYSVASAATGMKWSDITVTVDGVTRTLDLAAAPASCPSTTSANTKFLACGPTLELTTDLVNAGDSIYLPGVTAGQTLRLLDSQANSVMLTLTIG
jgi:flagellin-like protein